MRSWMIYQWEKIKRKEWKTLYIFVCESTQRLCVIRKRSKSANWCVWEEKMYNRKSITNNASNTHSYNSISLLWYCCTNKLHNVSYPHTAKIDEIWCYSKKEICVSKINPDNSFLVLSASTDRHHTRLRFSWSNYSALACWLSFLLDSLMKFLRPWSLEISEYQWYLFFHFYCQC
jgi:hypothetical protein